MSGELDTFLSAIGQMKRAWVGGYRAPHKPILLLAIMDLIENGDIKTNHIYLTDELIARFNSLWKYLVDDGTTADSFLVAEGLSVEAKKYPFKPNIELPFYHLSGEPFWKLIESEGFVKSGHYSIKKLRSCFSFAELDERLFSLMQSAIDRRLIRDKLRSMI